MTMSLAADLIDMKRAIDLEIKVAGTDNSRRMRIANVHLENFLGTTLATKLIHVVSKPKAPGHSRTCIQSLTNV